MLLFQSCRSAIDAANVIAQMGRAVDALPAALYGKEDLIFFVSQNVAKNYVRALGGFSLLTGGSNGYDSKGTMWNSSLSGLSFDGIRVEMVNGLPADTMVLSERSNLFFGTVYSQIVTKYVFLDMDRLRWIR